MIKKLLTGCISLQLMVTAVIHAEEAAPEKVTLNQLKHLATRRSPQLLQMRKRLEEFDARSSRQRSNYYPKLNAVGGGEVEGRGSDRPLNQLAYLDFNWNLYNGGRDGRAIETANLEAEKATLEVEESSLEVDLETERLFYEILYARDLIDILTKFIEVNKEHRSYVKRSQALGSVSEADVMQFDLKDAQLRSELIDMRRSYESAKTRLKAFIGDELSQSLEPIGELLHQHLKSSTDSILNESLTQSLPMRKSTIASQISELQLTSARSRWLPKIDFSTKAGMLASSETATPGEPNVNLSLVATWELFSGFDALSEIQEKRAAKEAQSLQVKLDVTKVVISAEDLVREILTLQTRADVEKNNSRFAKRYYNIIKDEYKRGYKNSADLTMGADAWYSAEVRRKELDLEFLKKRIELERLIVRRVEVDTMRDVID